MSAAKPALVVGVGEGCVPATRRALPYGSRWYVRQVTI